VLKEGEATAYLLLYFDDIILMASSTDLLQRIIARLHSEFPMTDLGDMHTSSTSPSRARQRVCSSPSASTLWIFYSGRAWPSVTLPPHRLMLVPSSQPPTEL
jgi:hypothetical protein